MEYTHLKSQSAVIEKVQKAFSKRLKGLKNKSYHAGETTNITTAIIRRQKKNK